MEALGLGAVERPGLWWPMVGRVFVFLLVMAVWPVSAETVAESHEIGPWPVVSRLIGYGDRIWFANSVKGANHNSADLYSLAVEGGPPRYEGHLFSQDAGHPVVHRGLLYWPLEDARTEPGIAAFDVTDGERWEHALIPTEQAFHNHAMVASGDRLYAAPSAWKGSVALSEDGGSVWRTVYLHPTPDRRVSRIVDLVVFGGAVYGSLNAPEGRRLIRVDDGSGEPVPGWPDARSHALTVHDGRLYGIVSRPDAGGVIRAFDGERSERIWAPPEGWTPRALASDGDRLWMAGDGADGASLWSSPNGRDWSETAMLDGGSPRDLVAHRGVIAVGGRGDDDRGIFWVFRPSAAGSATGTPPPDWPSFEQEAVDGYDWADAAVRLDRLLADPGSYARYAQTLRQAILALPRAEVPESFYPDRLKAATPVEPLPMFGGIALERMTVMARWRLYWGMGLARAGEVDPVDILRPWDYSPNRPFKFFSTPEIAIWAAGRVGSAEGPVLDALVRRLEDDATPLWLKGDAVGALFALTGQRLGYDAGAWRAWLEHR